MRSTATVVFSPFTRVEGDLRLEVDIEDGAVVSARASGTLFRGFEQMLRGRRPRDAIVFLCRICGQCGGAHSAASAGALADAWGVRPAPNAQLVTACIQATETLLSHLAHFQCSFAGDLCDLPGCAHLEERFAPIRGASFRKALRARRVLLGLMGLLAGKWPNTLAIQPGGVTRTLSRSELIRAGGILAEFVRYVEEDLLGCSSERWLANRSLDDVREWLGQDGHRDGDMGAFVSTALEAGLDRLGRGPGRFLSCGGFRLPGERTWLRGGYLDGALSALDPARIAEDVSCSWFEDETVAAYPAAARPVPAPEKERGYSWSKAPRYGGQCAEVGPMARMAVDGDPLALDLLRQGGPSVFARVLLRLHEIVRLAGDLRAWLDEIDPNEPFWTSHESADEADGFALTEAPRGTLGHWISLAQGRIRNCQVVTPTGWNLSPRDSEGRPGPLEQALVGTPVPEPQKAVNVALVVRSYDPCLYCSVH